MQNILVTGSSGLIGGIIQEKIHSFNLIGLDKVSSNYPKTIISDLSNLTELNKIMTTNNIETVIHLAADGSVKGNWYSNKLNNIEGTWNIFEASRLSGVKKIIFASTNHVIGMFENDYPYNEIVQGNYNNLKSDYVHIKEDYPIRPDSLYGTSKAFGENLGRYYYENYNLRVACLRIGSVIKNNNPSIANNSNRIFSTWCSHDDIAGLIKACIKSNNITFNIFFGVSNNKWRIWDIVNQKKVLNFTPKSNAENHREVD